MVSQEPHSGAVDAPAYFVAGEVLHVQDEQAKSRCEYVYYPTIHTESPWGQGGFQHGSPPAALVAVTLEDGAREHGIDLVEGRFCRMTVELLGAVPLSELRARVRVVRPGRRISLLETTISDESGRAYIRGTGWWVRKADTSDIERAVAPAMPRPETGQKAESFLNQWSSGYIDSVDVIRCELSGEDSSDYAARNPAVHWAKSDLPAVQGREDSPWVHLMKTVDIANGLNNILDPENWAYMNVDLSVYLHNMPAGEWVGLAAEANYGPDGIGTTVSRIYDEHGPIGTVNQAIMLDRLD